MSDSSDDDQINDIVLDEPMFYILTQFLETKDGKNIATVLDDIATELKAIRATLQTSTRTSAAPSSQVPAPPSSDTS